VSPKSLIHTKTRLLTVALAAGFAVLAAACATHTRRVATAAGGDAGAVEGEGTGNPGTVPAAQERGAIRYSPVFPGVVTTDDIPVFVDRMNKTLEKFDRRVNIEREKGAAPDALAKIDEQASKVRKGMVEIQALTDSKEILAKMEAVKADLAEARKMLRAAGGYRDDE